MADLRVSTFESKQAHFDKEKLDLDIDDDLGDYLIICLSPASRWLLFTLVGFYGEFHNRFQGFTEREADQLVAEATLGLICPMACQEDFLNLIAAVEAMNVTLVEIRDRLGDGESDLEVRVEEVSAAVDSLNTSLGGLGMPEILDALEPILNGVGIILGAPDVPLNGA